MSTETVDTPARLVSFNTVVYGSDVLIYALDECGVLWRMLEKVKLDPGTWVRVTSTNPPPEKRLPAVTATVE